MDKLDIDMKKPWTPESSSINGNGTSTHEGDAHSIHRNMRSRFMESFKRDPNISITRHMSVSSKEDLRKPYDVEMAAQATATSPLLRRLKSRHLQMIAIGGSIGTGLFVGSGKALAHGGPASVVIAFSLIGIMMFCTVQALGEMAVVFPVAGSFASYSTRFIDPAWGFAMGWNYALNWLVVLPLEIVSASITVDLWVQNTPLNALWVTIFWTLIVMINFFGVKGYGEAEFLFSSVKVTAIIGYIILGVIINVAGGPGGSYIGFKLWDKPWRFQQWIQRPLLSIRDSSFCFCWYRACRSCSSRNGQPSQSAPDSHETSKQVHPSQLHD